MLFGGFWRTKKTVISLGIHTFGNFEWKISNKILPKVQIACICHIDQQEAVLFESDFCVSFASYITLLLYKISHFCQWNFHEITLIVKNIYIFII